MINLTGTAGRGAQATLVVCLVIVCATVPGLPSAHGQQQARSPVRIVEITTDVQMTPKYDVSRSSALTRGRSRDWLIAEVEYESEPEWIDELTVTFYLHVRDSARDASGNRADLVLRGRTTYVDVKAGRHKAVMAMQPGSYERYGPVRRVGVELSVGGRTADAASEPSARGPWWTQMPSRDGLVIDRLSSPWAMLYFDEYEAIKGSTGTR